VPGLLDVGWREWPQGPVISVSAHGLWACTHNRRDYDAWFRSKVAEWDLVEGVHFVRIGGSVTRDYVRATTVDRLVHLSRSKASIEARRLVSGAICRVEAALAEAIRNGAVLPFMPWAARGKLVTATSR
jgi:hypothetical protein